MKEKRGIDQQSAGDGLQHYLSPVSVWALSFGCAVGWGAFVMPGTTFLPLAGPLGTLIGILIGAVIMFIIGVNYHYLMNKYPDAGGTLTYTIKIFGYDHGFMSYWFLILVYIAIIWANATALGLLSKNLLGSTLQFGFHYQIMGYDVYAGEVLLSVAAILLCGFVYIAGKRLAAGLQILFAVVLVVCVCVCAGMVIFLPKVTGIFDSGTMFSGEMEHPVKQILTIVALSPWAFVGFESVSNSASGFRFSVKKVLTILTVSLITGAFVYLALSQMAVSVVPQEYPDWNSYIKDLPDLQGIKGLPTFYSVSQVMGKTGVLILGLAAIAGILTGLIGNFIAASRLLYTMSEQNILPKWFGKLNGDANPGNAFFFLMAISVFIPFLGRAAIGWIVDVNTVGATIAYAYTSSAAFMSACRENNKKIQITGMTGIVMSVIFFFYFMSWSAGALATESYLILAAWSILGFVYFRYVFGRDNEKRFGKSTIVWIGLLFLIFFTSLMWVKQATDEMTQTVIRNVSGYYEEQDVFLDEQKVVETEQYLEDQLHYADRTLMRDSIIQMVLIVVSLLIMFSIYTTISKREKEMEVEKIAAEESNKAKTVFLSNMSHDIRTPMNAIIGYINLAEREDITLDEIKDYLGKIKGSGHHLLALINDVLEMSRIESGKMELELIAIDLKKTLMEVKDLFATQMEEKKIHFTVDVTKIRNGSVFCDKNRLNRVLLNLVSNAYKFTPEGGSVSILAKQSGDTGDGFGRYEIRIADSGIGMSKEFAEKVFEAFEREQTSTVSGIQGTGLGMSITKSIVDMMDGDISVKTEQGKGTEFILRLAFELQKEDETVVEGDGADDGLRHGERRKEEKDSVDFSSMRLLLVEDMDINREIATMQLTSFGFEVETAVNRKEAVEKVEVSNPGYYQAVLMDIQMPVMNGYEATEQIRALKNPELAKIPIVAMTANAFSEDVKKAHDTGMNAHIAKPIDVNVMMDVLTEVLGK